MMSMMVKLTLTYLCELTSPGTLGLLIISVGMPKTPTGFMANINQLPTRQLSLHIHSVWGLSQELLHSLLIQEDCHAGLHVIEQSSRQTASQTLEHL